MNENDKKIWLQMAMALVAAVLLFSTASAQKSKRKKVQSPPPAPARSAEDIKKLNEEAAESRENLVAVSNTYRESLERLLALQKQDEDRLSQNLEKSRKLLDLGVISRKQVEGGEQLLEEAKNKSTETEKQIASVDNLIAEVHAADEEAKEPPAPQGIIRAGGLMVRYVGASRWNLSDFGKVDAFYRLKFLRPLPVSAFGQTETHNRLGFDHTNAIDVAVHPDSAEGQALMEFLHGQGISFIAIRGAIQGSATGAHIHIGLSSRRIITKH